MKLRKSIWFVLLFSILSLSLSIENAYGFSIYSNTHSKEYTLKKNRSDNQEKPISVFFEEENVSENEDESTLEQSISWVNNQSFLFLYKLTKVQFSIPEEHVNFSRYSHPLFIIFRNLRL